MNVLFVGGPLHMQQREFHPGAVLPLGITARAPVPRSFPWPEVSTDLIDTRSRTVDYVLKSIDIGGECLPARSYRVYMACGASETERNEATHKLRSYWPEAIAQREKP